MAAERADVAAERADVSVSLQAGDGGRSRAKGRGRKALGGRRRKRACPSDGAFLGAALFFAGEKGEEKAQPRR